MIRYLLLIAMAFALFGCAPRTRLEANWIDIDDLDYALENKNPRAWMSLTGRAVAVEYHQDTVKYIFHYRAKLYETSYGKKEYKPKEDDVSGKWDEKREKIALIVYEGELIGIERLDEQGATEKKSGWLFF